MRVFQRWGVKGWGFEGSRARALRGNRGAELVSEHHAACLLLETCRAVGCRAKGTAHGRRSKRAGPRDCTGGHAELRRRGPRNRPNARRRREARRLYNGHQQFSEWGDRSSSGGEPTRRLRRVILGISP